MRLLPFFTKSLFFALFSQQEIEMRMTLANAEKRTHQLAAQLKKIEDLTDKNDKLLYHSLPLEVADKLKRGGNVHREGHWKIKRNQWESCRSI